MDQKHWFIAVVTPNTERSCASKLKDLFTNREDENPEVEAYVPVQREVHYWESIKRKKAVDRVLCPCYVFVRCTEAQRKAIKSDKRAQFLLYFLKDRALGNDHQRDTEFAVIPDHQMTVFRKMVEGEKEVTIDTTRLVRGAKVRVVSTLLRGEEGTLIRDYDGHHHLSIEIDNLGAATMTIDPADVEIIE